MPRHFLQFLPVEDINILEAYCVNGCRYVVASNLSPNACLRKHSSSEGERDNEVWIVLVKGPGLESRRKRGRTGDAAPDLKLGGSGSGRKLWISFGPGRRVHHDTRNITKNVERADVYRLSCPYGSRGRSTGEEVHVFRRFSQRGVASRAPVLQP